MTHYNPQQIEPRWQEAWKKNKTFKAKNKSDKPKFYALDMFPYPSGAGLHVGHPIGMTATDIMSRKRRHEGYNVLHPMGWDAFGLPAENFAIKTGEHPDKSTAANVENFRKQIQSLGFSYDWEREFGTTDTDYYKWTQWIFLELYKKGLLYEDKKLMNWCPSCKVVAANEEVEQGRHERCQTLVTRKALRQWMFRITDYAERLLKDLEDPNVVLIHGWGGTGKQGWFGEVQKVLENEKIKVLSPDFPNTQNPVYDEWKSYFEKEVLPHINEKTVLLGHSLGGGFIQRYLTEENLKVAEIVLLAPTRNDHEIDEIKNFFEADFDYQKVRNSADNVFVYGGGKDEYISKDDFEFLAQELNAHYVLEEESDHYSQSDGKDIPKPIERHFKNMLASRLDWPDKIKAMQSNWIGKSEGCEVDFDIEGNKVTVYTTRPDTLFGATFMVLSPEHPLVKEITTEEQKQAVEDYLKSIAAKSDMERTELNKDKTGVFIGAYATNPVNGEKIPVWIADYVLMSYGTGAIMAVPGHDERDNDFAQKYKIEIKEVIDELKSPYDKTGGVIKNSEYLNGLTVEEAIKTITEKAETEGFGKGKTNYKLRDWIFTRQRYWGEPIPLVFDEEGNCYPLSNDELPVKLPEVPNYLPSESGESPLSQVSDWVNVQGDINEDGTVSISKSGKTKFRRETSTMPNWAGSSWYWLRFMDPKNDQEFCSKETESYWGPVDLYVGGAEHAVLHLLYGRFWQKALYDLGYVSTREPFRKLVNQGLIVSYAYEDSKGSLVAIDQVEEKGEDNWVHIETGESVKRVTAKMSKSLKNVVNPDDIVAQYGADSLRIYEMFMGPFEQSKVWDTGALAGINKFLGKMWKIFNEKEIIEACPSEEFTRLTHQTVKKVTEDIEAFKFNTAISHLMVWSNAAVKEKAITKVLGGKIVRLLSPLAPHIAEEIWQKRFKPESKTISFEPWPSYSEEYLVENQATYAVQINGKVRADFSVAADMPKEEVLAAAKEIEKVQKYLAEGTVRKEIFVPGKIVGFVVG